MRDDEPIRFQTRSGVLTCRQAGETIELDFPTLPTIEAEPAAGLLEALGVRPTFVGKSTFDKFLVVESEEVVRSLKPDFRALGSITGMRGVIVTSPQAPIPVSISFPVTSPPVPASMKTR